MATEKREHFASSIGFVLAMVGSAVGLGNIWRFPYLAAKEAGKFSFPVLFYLVLYVVIMVAGGFFYKKNKAIEE